MNETRISLSLTPASLDAVAMALQCLQAITAATLNDIRAQVQAMQAPGITPTNDEAPAASAEGLSNGHASPAAANGS